MSGRQGYVDITLMMQEAGVSPSEYERTEWFLTLLVNAAKHLGCAPPPMIHCSSEPLRSGCQVQRTQIRESCLSEIVPCLTI